MKNWSVDPVLGNRAARPTDGKGGLSLRRLGCCRALYGLSAVAGLLALAGVAPAADEAGVEFFEKRIRPVLVERCYECHNCRDKREGGLSLDHRDGVLEGGDSGEAVVPGRPEKSLLISAIDHSSTELRMPQGGPKLPAAVVADFVKWIKLGAPDPRDKPPSAAELSAATSWEATRQRRKQWWSFQPVVRPDPPATGTAWSDHPIDRFLFADMQRAQVSPAAPADRRTLIRRATFAITGLPPTAAEIEEFVRDESPRAYERVVDRLLASPSFGERWARHWMDWFRFAESHGSEGDPAIPHAWRYRDYLIRALNSDIAYDQLIREHLAGDLLPEPRISRELGVNESALATAHFRMVQHGYAPTDALDEQVTFTDNQIDVVSKALLGLTVSCARCHNHKFDPISQADYYAFYGIMASCRPALITVDAPQRRIVHREELLRMKTEIKRRLAVAWIKALDDVPLKLNEAAPEIVDKAAKERGNALHAWAALRGLEGPNLTQAWERLKHESAEMARQRASENAAGGSLRWDLTGKDYDAWFKHGNGLDARPSPAGEFHVLPGGEQVVSNIYPAGVYSHLISSKHNAVFSSPRFKIETDSISLRAAGGQNARARLVVQNYPRVPGLLYEAYQPDGEQFAWRRWDTRYWKGEWAHIEIATAEDLPVEIKPGQERSWFGISQVVGGDPPPQRDAGGPLFAAAGESTPASSAALAALYAKALRGCVESWAAGAISDEQAEFLGSLVRAGMLPNTLEGLPELAPLIAEYRKLEAQIPAPTRSPGILEGTAFDQPLFVRGDHKQPGGPVARRFLEVFDGQPYATRQSGRLELAADIADPRNPLTARVIVNRLWHHLFGRGIVATTDNFGRLGEEPVDRELLDYLAAQFVDEGWSIKRMIRSIVTSKSFQIGNRSSGGESDPKLFASFPIRRLEAECLRDSILSVSGRLEPEMYGPSVSGQSRRRSIYVRTQRSALDPFLSVFDAPEPNTTRGNRDATNVPAQSLALMNDPWVIEQARHWAEKITRDSTLAGDRERIGQMFVSALGRPAADEEIDRCQQYLQDQAAEREKTRRVVQGLEAKLAGSNRRLSELLAPVRANLVAQRATGDGPSEAPRPIARWEFDKDLHDSLGDLHGTAHGAARLESGALALDGGAHVQTAPLTRPLKEKTLEAWTLLDDLEQRGGGVMSVETVGGGVFDAIVFGEQQPRQWLAGSDFFRRTQSFEGPEEDQSAHRAVQLAIVYQADGTILAYRDGKPYGKPYRSAGPIVFEAASSHILFGLRHSPSAGGKMLKGRILQAQLYDRALAAEEIAASAAAFSGSVTDEQVLAALSPEARGEHDRLTGEIAALDAELKRYEPRDQWKSDPVRRWQDLAHAIFSLKEFIYVR